MNAKPWKPITEEEKELIYEMRVLIYSSGINQMRKFLIEYNERQSEAYAPALLEGKGELANPSLKIKLESDHTTDVTLISMW